MEATAVGGSKNYMAIQFIVMFLFGGNPITNLKPSLFHKISHEYPIAVSNIVGERKNLDTINVPEFGPDYKDKLPQIWKSIDQHDKNKIIQIYTHIHNNIGGSDV